MFVHFDTVSALSLPNAHCHLVQKNSLHTFAGEEIWALLCLCLLPFHVSNTKKYMLQLHFTDRYTHRLAYYKHYVNATFCQSVYIIKVWVHDDIFLFIIFIMGSCDALTISKSMLSWLRFQYNKIQFISNCRSVKLSLVKPIFR